MYIRSCLIIYLKLLRAFPLALFLLSWATHANEARPHRPLSTLLLGNEERKKGTAARTKMQTNLNYPRLLGRNVRVLQNMIDRNKEA